MMKKIFLFFAVTLFTMNIWGQNEFPTAQNSHVKIDGGAINFFRPVTTGGWARGLDFYNIVSTNRWAGIGLYGASDNINNIFLAHGQSPWNSGLGIYIKPDGSVGIGITNPLSKLDIHGTITLNSDSEHTITKLTNGTLSGLESTEIKGRNIELYAFDNVFLRAGTQDDIIFHTGENEKMRILSNGNVGIGTTNPIVKLQVKGPSDVEAAIITSFSNLSSDNYSTGNWYRSFSGATYTNGNSGGIVNYLTYRSVYGGYLDYNGQGYGFYSQGHYPRMFMEVISGNHGTFGNLPGDSPIKNGYIYQQIKGPSAGPLASPVKATNTNSQWLWGVKSTGDIVVAGKIECREVKVTAQAGADFVFEADYALLPLMELEKFVREHKHLPEVASAKEMEEKGVNQSEMNQKLLQKIEELTLYVIEQQKEINELKKQITTEPSK